MSKRKVRDWSTTCNIILGSERALEVAKSGPRQSSARVSSLKADTVSLARVGEAGPPCCGIEDEPPQGHCDFQFPRYYWQTGHD